MKRNRPTTDAERLMADEIQRLREELADVRQVLQELQDEWEWANQKRSDTDSVAMTPRRITSMPLDPASPYWAEQVNRYSAADLPTEARDSEPKKQGNLF